MPIARAHNLVHDFDLNLYERLRTAANENELKPLDNQQLYDVSANFREYQKTLFGRTPHPPESIAQQGLRRKFQNNPSFKPPILRRLSPAISADRPCESNPCNGFPPDQ